MTRRAAHAEIILGFTAFLKRRKVKTLKVSLKNCFRTASNSHKIRNLKLKRAHRARIPMPTNEQSKPRSIIVRFASYKTKEEVVRRAWQKKQIQYSNEFFYINHDYPPAILKKHADCSQLKYIKFQTPHPARLRVFYAEETRMYQTAAEAT